MSISDAHFAELCRLYKRLQPRTVKRPDWWLFQRWLRKRPLNHEFLVSPIGDYLYSCGISVDAIMRIQWPDWCFQLDMEYKLAGDGWREKTVRDCLRALDSMRGWTPRMNGGRAG